MIKNIVNRITERWISNGIIAKEYCECYAYGLEVTLLSVVGVINILLLGTLTNTLPNTIFFLMTFISVRQFTGGYHADSSLKCNIYFAIVYLINMFFTYYCYFNIGLLIIFTLILGLCTIPILDYHGKDIRKFRHIDSNKNKKKALLLYFLCIVCSILMIRINSNITKTVNIALIECIILMLVGYIQEKSLHKERSRPKKGHKNEQSRI